MTIEDCERVSRELGACSTSRIRSRGSYTLEVSSPGFDGVLRTQAHFARFVGERVLVELGTPREGRRTLYRDAAAADGSRASR